MFQPLYRPRRLRSNENIRRMVRETKLSPDDFIYPLFVTHGKGVKKEIGSMPGNYQQSIDNIVKDCEEVMGLGIPSVLLFGIPEHKDEVGSEAYSDEGIVQHAIKAIKNRTPELIVITDVCLCEYTSHGHCGPIKGDTVDNDATLDIIAKVAVNHARAGADIVAPSGMMDGMVHAIRSELDFNGLKDTIVMSYAAKYASAMYGPFREAADSGFTGFDRTSYQMDPRNSDEAMREVALDLEEGADIVMVKPALSYLDIVYRVKKEFGVPVAAYSVSGEYAMVKAAAAKGWLDERKTAVEMLLSMKRAGADMLITYFAKDVASIL